MFVNFGINWEEFLTLLMILGGSAVLILAAVAVGRCLAIWQNRSIQLADLRAEKADLRDENADLRIEIDRLHEEVELLRSEAEKKKLLRDPGFIEPIESSQHESYHSRIS